MGATELALEWEPPLTNGAPLLLYEVRLERLALDTHEPRRRLADVGGWRQAAVVPAEAAPAALLRGLEPGGVYRAAVVARNACGTGAPGAASEPLTLAAAAPAPPQGVALCGGAAGARGARFAWGASVTNGAPLTGHVCCLRQLSVDGTEAAAGLALGGEGAAVEVVEEEEAEGEGGEGEAAGAGAEAGPSSAGAAARVSFSLLPPAPPPLSAGGAPLPPSVRAALRALRPGLEYAVTFAARNAAGTSAPSPPLRFRCAPTAPAAPAPPRVTAVTTTSVSLTWAPPLTHGAPLSGFVLEREQLSIDPADVPAEVTLRSFPWYTPAQMLANAGGWVVAAAAGGAGAGGGGWAEGATVGGLLPGTRYRFRVSALNAVGRSPPSACSEPAAAADEHGQLPAGAPPPPPHEALTASTEPGAAGGVRLAAAQVSQPAGPPAAEPPSRPACLPACP